VSLAFQVDNHAIGNTHDVCWRITKYGHYIAIGAMVSLTAFLFRNLKKLRRGFPSFQKLARPAQRPQ
jgi:hypothetical protein